MHQLSPQCSGELKPSFSVNHISVLVCDEIVIAPGVVNSDDWFFVPCLIFCCMQERRPFSLRAGDSNGLLLFFLFFPWQLTFGLTSKRRSEPRALNVQLQGKLRRCFPSASWLESCVKWVRWGFPRAGQYLLHFRMLYPFHVVFAFCWQGWNFWYYLQNARLQWCWWCHGYTHATRPQR